MLQPREGAAAVVGALRAALDERARASTSAASVRVGIGDAVDGIDVRQSWLQARLAERFAVPNAEPVVVNSELGSLTAAMSRSRPGRSHDRLRAVPIGP